MKTRLTLAEITAITAIMVAGVIMFAAWCVMDQCITRAIMSASP